MANKVGATDKVMEHEDPPIIFGDGSIKMALGASRIINGDAGAVKFGAGHDNYTYDVIVSVPITAKAGGGVSFGQHVVATGKVIQIAVGVAKWDKSLKAFTPFATVVADREIDFKHEFELESDDKDGAPYFWKVSSTLICVPRPADDKPYEYKGSANEQLRITSVAVTSRGLDGLWSVVNVPLGTSFSSVGLFPTKWTNKTMPNLAAGLTMMPAIGPQKAIPSFPVGTLTALDLFGQGMMGKVVAEGPVRIDFSKVAALHL